MKTEITFDISLHSHYQLVTEHIVVKRIYKRKKLKMLQGYYDINEKVDTL